MRGRRRARTLGRSRSPRFPTTAVTLRRSCALASCSTRALQAARRGGPHREVSRSDPIPDAGDSAAPELRPLAKLVGVGPSPELLNLARWAARRWVGRRATFFGTASPPRVVEAVPAAPAASSPVPAVSPEPGPATGAPAAAVRCGFTGVLGRRLRRSGLRGAHRPRRRPRTAAGRGAAPRRRPAHRAARGRRRPPGGLGAPARCHRRAAARRLDAGGRRRCGDRHPRRGLRPGPPPCRRRRPRRARRIPGRRGRAHLGRPGGGRRAGPPGGRSLRSGLADPHTGGAAPGVGTARGASAPYRAGGLAHGGGGGPARPRGRPPRPAQRGAGRSPAQLRQGRVRAEPQGAGTAAGLRRLRRVGALRLVRRRGG